MAFYSYPFESQNTGTAEQPVYDRAITAENERQFNKLRYTNGVFIESSLDDDLQVIPGNGMAVKVSKGGCHIEGALAYNDNAITLSLEAANSTLRRIDRIVARFNTSTNVRSIMVYVKTGTNATNPVAPALQRESNFWELGLADITIPAGATSISASNILDTRMDDSLCGRVLPAIPYVTQLGALYQQYQDLVDSALSGTVAGQLEARIAAEEEKIQPVNKGGTGATTAAEARTNLGVKACGTYDILPIAKGGTGKTTAVEALKALGGVSLTKLWENASSTSAFSDQKITLDLSEYDYIMIIFNYNTSSNTRMIPPIISPVNNGGGIIDNAEGNRRYFTNTATFINFDTTYPTNIKTACIPLFIYGLKGVL
jgi:hypothetical protein|nr:MAG TPA: Receptor Binding Protein [Caudoviricetes sp.]